MKIIIVGCGKIGKSMIHSLTAEGHDVLVIDKNADVLNETTDIYDVMGICGNAVDFDTLENGTVTVRDRDTMEQIRVSVDEAIKYIEEKLEF